jgi:hypothetical protein
VFACRRAIPPSVSRQSANKMILVNEKGLLNRGAIKPRKKKIWSAAD